MDNFQTWYEDTYRGGLAIDNFVGVVMRSHLGKGRGTGFLVVLLGQL